MKRSMFLFLVFISFFSQAQTLERPKLVVGIVIDQMRWDYLYRYYDRYAADGGFKRLLKNGFSCENTFIPYTPSVTACGHASIYTGSVPAINGITGNAWVDRLSESYIYCVEDKSVKSVGSSSDAGLMSPKNLLVTTITDELRLATNFRSKVIGIALKDRGSILPAGHSANAAYWYDGSVGNWITSTFYMGELPKWVTDFNNKKLVDTYYNKDWNTLYPINTYIQSTADKVPYEAKTLGGQGFPYNLKQYAGKNYSLISTTPYGNSFTVDFAKEAIINENLGKNSVTDFLAVSFSSPDYVGHSFGPNSVEEEDTYLRLDKDLGDLFNFLDQKVGKNQYLVFLSADHGAAHVPGFLKEHRFPAATFSGNFIKNLNTAVNIKYGKDNLITNFLNYQIYLNRRAIDSMKINEKELKDFIIANALKAEGVARAFDINEIRNATLNSKVSEMMSNGYFPNRCGDIQVMLLPQYVEGFGAGGTSHGLWNPYDTHIPLLFYGWGIKPGKTNRETYMSDIAPTIAALLHIQMPSGTVGKVIEEVK